MHPLLTIASVGAGLFAGARLARRVLKNNARKREQHDLARRGNNARTIGELKPDPKSGIYKPE